nr:hypothetical protein CFP56_56700 [Quercus suber]
MSPTSPYLPPTLPSLCVAGAVAENAANASAQCPITKAQCEQLLALFNPEVDQGQNHHVASVSTSGSVSGLITEANGVPVAASVSSSSAHANFIDTMSGNDSFVTPISVPNFVPNDGNDAFFPSSLSVDPNTTISDNVTASSLLSADISPSPSQVPFTATPSSPPVVPAPPMPLRKVSVVYQASCAVAYEKPAPTGPSKNIMLAV